jgi:putative peptidoglycan lipid II flippase
LPSHLATRNILNRLARITPIQWLILCAVVHFIVTLTVFLIGHFRLFPNTFDEHGIGISFAIDGVTYRQLIAELAEALRHDGFSSWLNIQAPIHCRLYSFAFVFPGALIGYNIVAAEPLNLVYYLGILSFVYLLGKEIFDPRTGLIATGIIAVWPSFLLHSTQLIRDPLSILLLLILLLILAIVLGRELSWRHSFFLGIGSIVLVTIFWLTRGNIWNIVFAALLLTTIFFLIRMLNERRLLGSNLALLVVIFASVLVVPTKIESTSLPGSKPPTALIAIPSGEPTNSRSLLTRLIAQINGRRGAFNGYTGKASNIDENVSFKSGGDMVSYLPRATIIGLFAPFPRMWFETGTGGRAGRLLAGLETLVVYLLYVPAAVCVWNKRRNLKVWLVASVAMLGMIALGLVVANAGALFRLRYVFWMLVIVLAVEGVKILRRKRNPVTA